MNLWVPNKTFPLNSYVYKHKCNVTIRIRTITLPGPPRGLGPEPPHSSVCRPWTLHLLRSNVRPKHVSEWSLDDVRVSNANTDGGSICFIIFWSEFIGGEKIIKKTIVKPRTTTNPVVGGTRRRSIEKTDMQDSITLYTPVAHIHVRACVPRGQIIHKHIPTASLCAWNIQIEYTPGRSLNKE